MRTEAGAASGPTIFPPTWMSSRTLKRREGRRPDLVFSTTPHAVRGLAPRSSARLTPVQFTPPHHHQDPQTLPLFTPPLTREDVDAQKVSGVSRDGTHDVSGRAGTGKRIGLPQTPGDSSISAMMLQQVRCGQEELPDGKRENVQCLNVSLLNIILEVPRVGWFSHRFGTQGF